MNNRQKKIAMLGGGLVVIGGSVAVIGTLLGGSPNLGTMAYTQDGWEVGVFSQQVNKGDLRRIDTGVQTLEMLEEIEISVPAMDITITEGEAYTFELQAYTAYDIEWGVDTSGTFQIKHANASNNMDIEEVEGTLDITVPEGATLKKVEIDSGLGVIELSKGTIESVDIELGLGDIDLLDVTVGDLKLNTGLGDIASEHLISADTSVRTGLGDITLEGSFEGDVAIDTGMGSVEVAVDKPFEAYNYNMQKGMGVVEVNGEDYVFQNVNTNHQAPYTIKIQNGMGTIELHTRE